MRFDPPQEFTVEEPERLGLELGLFVDAVERALQGLELERTSRPTVRRIRGKTGTLNFQAALGDLLVINTEDADVVVQLPKLGPLTSGREVAFVRVDTTNALTFEGALGAQINGADTFVAALAVGRGPDLVNDGIEWWA